MSGIEDKDAMDIDHIIGELENAHKNVKEILIHSKPNTVVNTHALYAEGEIKRVIENLKKYSGDSN